LSGDAHPPTDFRSVLRDLVTSVPGAWGAIFVDFEGEAVDLFAVSDAYEVKLAGAHAGLLWNRIVSASQDARMGRALAVSVLAAGNRFFIHAVDREYFVLLGAKTGSSPSSRHQLAIAIDALKRLL